MLWNRYIILICFILPAFSAFIFPQQQSGTVTGKVADRYSHLENQILLVLTEVTTQNRVQETEPDSSGVFIFRNVPFGGYKLSVLLDNSEIDEKQIAVMSPVPVYVDLDTLREYQTKEVIVTADNYADKLQMASSKTFYTASSIQPLTAQSTTKLIETVLLNTPGVVPDEDGRMHVRGEDAQMQYVIDGIPVTSNMTRVYSGLFDARLIKSVNIQTGNLNAEYGVAAAGILAVTTRSGFDKPLFFNASAGMGSFNTKEAGLLAGGSLGSKSALFFGVNTSKTDRYLDPIQEGDPLHDNGSSSGFFGKLNYSFSGSTDISILGGYNTADFSIPNSMVKTPEQNQQQNHRDYLLGARLNAALTGNSVLSFLIYQHQAKAKVTSGGMMNLTPEDYPAAILQNERFFIGGERVDRASGAQIEYSLKPAWFSLSNNFKAGVAFESFPVSEMFSFAVTDPVLSEPSTSGGDARFQPYDITRNGKPFYVNQSKTGFRYSAFAQDQAVMGKWVFSAGMRMDYFSFLQNEFYLSPRIGAAYNITNDLVLRASYNRVVMQAPLENILVSSSDEARRLTGLEQGNVPINVKSEKEHNFELGAGYRLNRYLDFELVGYAKLIEDFLVKVELGNSGVIFPVNLKNGFAAGGELRTRLYNWNNFSGYMSLTTCASYGMKPGDGSSPIAAGLIFGEEGENYNHPFAGEDIFPTEHNQLFTAVLNVAYNHPIGLLLGINGRFDSGLPFDLVGPNGEGLTAEESRTELKRRGYSDKVIDMLSLESEKPGSPDKSVAPHATFDLTAGYDFRNMFSIPLRITASVINVFDTQFLYKFESSFGGTHFGYPRMFTVRAEVYY